MGGQGEPDGSVRGQRRQSPIALFARRFLLGGVKVHLRAPSFRKIVSGGRVNTAMRRRFALLLWLISDVASPMKSVTQARPDLSRLQSILNKKSVQWNTSFSIGVFSESLGSFGAAGYIYSERIASSRPHIASRCLASRCPLPEPRCCAASRCPLPEPRCCAAAVG
jgi:hypothetical protein